MEGFVSGEVAAEERGADGIAQARSRGEPPRHVLRGGRANTTLLAHYYWKYLYDPE